MIDGRVADLDWPALEEELDTHGVASAGSLLRAEECAAVAQQCCICGRAIW
ncbi:MAG TPA: hypothetical protein VGI32_07115 [Steroidobacteraceae bacterium]